MRKVTVAGFLLLLASALVAQQTLNNDAVIKLIKAGLSEDLIVTTINASPGSFDTSANGLIALKGGGATDKEIAAIVVKSSGGGSAAGGGAGAAGGGLATGGFGAPAGATGGIPAGVDSVGVYYQDATTGTWEEVPAEVVNFKTGGAFKHIASGGLIKGDMNGMVGGNRSKLALKMPASFIFYVPEGRSPGEYQLLRLRVNQQSREFRSATGGIAHESGGAIRDYVDYISKKLAPRVYQVTLSTEVGRGEFGFLPPADNVSGNNMASSGKIYSFALVQ